MRRTNSATLELPEDTLVMLSFHFLFTRTPTPACPLLASERYSMWPLWRVVKLSSFLRTSPSPITSHFISVDPNHLLGHRHPSCWGLGALADLNFACWFSWATLPLWPMRVGRRYRNCSKGLSICPVLNPEQGGVEFGAPGLGICVPTTEELYLPCCLTQLLAALRSIGWFGMCVFLLLDQLPYQAVELGLHGFWDHSFPSPRPTACQG